ncbi:hypothetical protein Tco_0650395 [Tanacetum coccineum]
MIVGRPRVDNPRADKEDMCDHSYWLVQLSVGCAPHCSSVGFRDAIDVHEMFNGGVEMLSLYMICSTDESRYYRYTLDVQRRSRDAIVVHEMFNGGVEMLSLYMRCSMDELRYVQRRSRDAIIVHEMFNGGVEMLSLYMRCSMDELRCYRCTLDVQRSSRDAIVVNEMFNG